MATLAHFIAFLNPSAKPGVGYVISDDGIGAKITKWDLVILGPRPTAQAITDAGAATDAALAAVASTETARLVERDTLKEALAVFGSRTATNAQI